MLGAGGGLPGEDVGEVEGLDQERTRVHEDVELPGRAAEQGMPGLGGDRAAGRPDPLDLADRHRRQTSSSSSRVGHRNVSCCCRTCATLTAGSPGAASGLRPASGPRSSGRPGRRRRARPRSGRRSASPRAAADSSLTQVIASTGHFDVTEMSTDVREVRWSYPQLSMMLDLGQEAAHADDQQSRFEEVHR